MRRILLAAFVLIAAQFPALAQERITNFISDVTVQTNGDLDVTETITIQAEGSQFRRGIFRDFPTSYRRRSDGTNVVVGFDVIAVTRNGQSEPYSTEGYQNGIRTRIGSANVFIPRGPHTYTIRYRTTRQVGFFEKFDELYWNATGNGWNFYIDNAEARITLPQGAQIGQNALYTGAQGDNGKDARVVEQTQNRIVWRTTRRLPPNNGLTVAVAWQKGIVSPPSGAQQASYFFQDNLPILAALIGIIGIGFYYLSAWTRVGRDPPEGTIIPLFGPPNNMSPAAARYLDQLSFDNRAFTAAIVDLGVKGHLSMAETPTFTQVTSRAGGKALAPAEEAMRAHLFAQGGSIALTQSNHVVIGGAKTELENKLSAEYNGKMFANNFGWSFLGFALAIVAVAVMIYAIASTKSGDQVAAGIMGILIPGGLMLVATGVMMAGFTSHKRWNLWIITGAILWLLIAAGGLGFIYAVGGGVNLNLDDSGGCGLGDRDARAVRVLLAEGAEPRGASPARPDLGFPRISRCRGRRSPECDESAEENAGAVREIPALCDRARCRECVGQEIRGRARRGSRCGCRGLCLVSRQPRLEPGPGGILQSHRRHRRGRDLFRFDRAGLVQRLERRRFVGRRRRRRRRRRLVAAASEMIRRLFLSLLFLAALSGAAQSVELIKRFESDVEVQSNGDLIVTENITVNVELREIRRGILRDFPTVYSLRDGRRVAIGFEVLSVQRNGWDEKYSTESLFNGTRIRIGDPSQMLSRGEVTYTIKYRTTRQIGFYPDFDELYWNVTGTGWTFDIENVVATIKLPVGAKIQARSFYTGAQGAKGQDARVVGENENLIVFRNTQKLPARNGLTVAIAWQKGIVSPPGPLLAARYFVFDNIAASLSLLGFATVFFYFFYQWFRYGRDPAKGMIIPVFEPPSGVSAAGMRFIDKYATYDNKTFTAAIVELGVKGHLKITEKDNVTSVEKRDGGRTIYDGEEAVKRHFFPKDKHKTLELKKENHVRIGGANDALKTNLKRLYDDLFRNNYGKWSLGLFLTLAAVVLCLTGIGLQFSGAFAIDAFLGTLLPIIPLLLASFALNNGFTARDDNGFLVSVGIIFGILPAAIGLWYVWRSVDGIYALIPTLCAFASTILCAFYLEWMEAPTPQGRKMLDHIEGFREYLGTADEGPRLEALNPPAKTPELFERMLPYAIALDVENTWAEKFKNVLAAAAVAPAAAASAAAISHWYSGKHDWSKESSSFTSAISSSLTTTVAASATAPGTSSSYSGSSSSSSSSYSGGSSGGGSSGGGGGGGGGSGW